MTLFWGLGCYMVLAHQVKFAQDIGYSSIFAASIFGLYGLSMVAGQLTASISDKIGREWVLVTGCMLSILSVFALTHVHDTSSSWLLYVFPRFWLWFRATCTNDFCRGLRFICRQTLRCNQRDDPRRHGNRRFSRTMAWRFSPRPVRELSGRFWNRDAQFRPFRTGFCDRCSPAKDRFKTCLILII